MIEYLIRDFKGHSIGYNYDENTDTYEWFIIEPPSRNNPEVQRGFSRITFSGEWAAQAARVRFLDNINSMFDRFFKRKFAKIGIDPATGHREVNNVQQVPQPPHDS